MDKAVPLLNKFMYYVFDVVLCPPSTYNNNSNIIIINDLSSQDFISLYSYSNVFFSDYFIHTLIILLLWSHIQHDIFCL